MDAFFLLCLLLTMVVTVSGWSTLLHRTTLFRQLSDKVESRQRLHLNRLLFDPEDIEYNSEGVATVVLGKDDYRTIHAATILDLEDGDTIRAGIVSSANQDGLVTDNAVVEWMDDSQQLQHEEGTASKTKKKKVSNNKTKSSLRIKLVDLTSNSTIQEPRVSLILALPRPLQLSRILPMVSQMGVSDLVLILAKKVPRDYFGSHLIRKPELLRERLIEGLCQAGDVRLPEVHLVKNPLKFLENDLDRLFPADSYARVIAHPQRSTDDEVLRLSEVEFPASTPRMVIAVGPEGGWEEPLELEHYKRHGFKQITLGTRVLRSDCAVISLLSLANDACL